MEWAGRAELLDIQICGQQPENGVLGSCLGPARGAWERQFRKIEGSPGVVWLLNIPAVCSVPATVWPSRRIKLERS